MNREGRPETLEEIRTTLERTETLLRSVEFAASYTIDDYPIGGANRGKCEMGYEFKKGKGYRTVRRTTDKRGVWCKPKSCTFQPSPIVVVYGPDLQHEAAWLRCEYYGHGMYLQWANGDCEYLCKSPLTSPPRRADETYTMMTTKLHFDRSGISPDGEPEKSTHTLYADSAEDIALWDAFMEGYRPLFDAVKKMAVLAVSPSSV